jgi:glyoxylase-like metal-dependent hydrolase (beta-lactamase superfamily II)
LGAVERAVRIVDPELEVAPGVFRLVLPLDGNPLGSVNAYAVRSGSGICLIDCGWDTPSAYEALCRTLAGIGSGIADIYEILVTHIHPDHFGLAGRVAAESGASLVMHRLEAAFVTARYEDAAALIGEMEDWLRVHGTPDLDLEPMAAGSVGMLRRVGTRSPDRVLEGGETLTWGERALEVVWTPGHSVGLICLFDRATGLLFSSDHVLQRISPHVGLHTQSFGNPLGDYLRSLDSIAGLPATLVLPGHGTPFVDLGGRARELTTHHTDRLNHMAGIVATCRCTAFDVARALPWRGSTTGWQRLEAFQRRMALTETIAHLEYLHIGGRLLRHFDGRHFTYEAIQARQSTWDNR